MAGVAGITKRNLFGSSLHILGKLVLDEQSNLYVSNSFQYNAHVAGNVYTSGLSEYDIEKGISVTGNINMQNGYILNADKIKCNSIVSNITIDGNIIGNINILGNVVVPHPYSITCDTITVNNINGNTNFETINCNTLNASIITSNGFVSEVLTSNIITGQIVTTDIIHCNLSYGNIQITDKVYVNDIYTRNIREEIVTTGINVLCDVRVQPTKTLSIESLAPVIGTNLFIQGNVNLVQNCIFNANCVQTDMFISPDNKGVVIGNTLTVCVDNSSIAIGKNASTSNYTNAIAIGTGAQANSDNLIRLGDINITQLECQVGLTITSDERDKCNIETLTTGLDFIKNLEPKKYNLNSRTGDTNVRVYDSTPRVGFIAQSVLRVQELCDAHDVNIVTSSVRDGIDYYGVTLDHLHPIYVNAFKELLREIEQLKQRVQDLETRR